MINPTSDDPARSETVVLESVSRLERTVFHGILVRHIRNTDSRFYRIAAQYGTSGAAKLIIVNAWLALLGPFGLCAVVLGVVSRSNSPLRTVSYVLVGLVVLACFVLIGRALAATRRRPGVS